ncbi:MAG: glycine/D-amino acid oxidase-like deaminating enzyme [Halieaceae bacterium]|jgi:glycine/D-amino acid oxidase-like deaminating enzyme
MIIDTIVRTLGSLAKMAKNDELSFWWADLKPTYLAACSTELPEKTDIAIIGAGYTGLWTAYYLLQVDPNLSITIIEAETPGFGASGRNGGWCAGETSGMHDQIADPASRESALRLQRQMFDTVDEIARVCARENIDCHYDKGGSLHVAPTPFHAKKMLDELQHQYRHGVSDADTYWMDEATSRDRVNTRENHGAIYTPHCAAIHPLRLVQGLVEVLIAKKVRIVCNTPATSIQPGCISTARGQIKCHTALRATEAYTDTLAEDRLSILPVYSLMVATEPLSTSQWNQIGLHQRETFGMAQRAVTYGQRTRDNRMAFGARGGYLFGSRLKRHFTRDDPALDQVVKTLYDIFPALSKRKIEHAWGGMLGVPRSWTPYVRFDPATQIGSAGGYVGEGVAASNLAARTLADLALQRATPLTALPWVDAKSRRWEPEPLRWLGYTLAKHAGNWADRSERINGKTSGLAGRIYDALSG